MKKIIGLLFICSFCLGYGQTEDQSFDFKKLSPPNPNVASIMKPVLTPVTEYAGIPNISIPLYTINEGNINFPISLNYHAGGIQVAEESGNVGLGWALNAGGLISRTVYGTEDFGENGNSQSYLRLTSPMADFEEFTAGGETYFNPGKNKFLRADDMCRFPIEGSLVDFTDPSGYLRNDYMPDIFHFSFGGNSGSFILTDDGDVFLLEKTGIDITLNYPDAETGNYTFTIITEDGTKYFFDKWARTIFDQDTGTWHTTAWYLTKIITITNREINFTYEELGQAGQRKSFPIKTFVQQFIPAGDLQNNKGPQAQVDDLYLTKITFSNGEVNFNYSDEGERQDIPYAHYLKSMEVSNFQKVIKRHDFNYTYFGKAGATSGNINSGDYQSEVGYNVDNPHLNLRLRLDSTVEDLIKEHKFSYYDANLVPNKTSMSQDYWGFYNGIRNERTFIPNVQLTTGSFTIPNPAKRYPIESKAKLFSLYRIIYPTKGVTEFEYESNTYIYGADAFEQNFWTTDDLPFDVTASPLNTVPRKEFVTSYGDTNVITKEVSFQTTASVNVRFDLAIYGSTVPQEHWSDIRSAEHPIDFGVDMRLVLRRNVDGAVIQPIGYNSEQAITDFQATGQAFRSVSLDYPNLNSIQGYTLEAYFNNHGGIYFGQAKITASWEEEEEMGTADNPLKYSVGGGLRVKSIYDYNSDGYIARKRNFNYHFKQNLSGLEVERSHGKIKTLPDFGLNHPLGIVETDADGTDWVGILASSTSQNPMSKHLGSYVGYSQVEMTYENTQGEDNGKTVSKYYNFFDYLNRGNNLNLEYLDNYHRFNPIRIPHNGKLYEQQQYKRVGDNNYTLLSETKNEYRINDFEASSFTARDFFKSSQYIMAGKLETIALVEPTSVPISNNTIRCRNYMFQFHPHYASRVELGSTQAIQYDENGENPVTTNQQFYYDNPIHYMTTRTETVDSEGNTINTQTWYPDDLIANNLEGGPFSSVDALPAILSLQANRENRRVGQPIQTVTTNNGEKTIQRTKLKAWDDGIVLPEISQTLKGEPSVSNVLQNRAIIHDYDSKGNPIEVSGDNGPKTSYIWGHNKTYVIAKIANASYNDIASTLGISIAALKNFDETDIAAINGLRTALPSALITTYTYDPLIGITTITDPRDYTMLYTYDAQRRLIEIKDDKGHIVKDYDYHYADQN